MKATDFLDGSDDLGSSQSAESFLDATEPKKQNKGILGDIGTGLKRGVEQMPGMVTGIADIAAAPVSAITGINRPFSRAADYVGEKTGFQPAKWAEQAAQEYSPEMQQSLKAVEQADGFTGTLKAIGENPRSAVNLIAESLPSTLAGGFLARGAMGAVVGAEKLAAMKAAGDTAGLMKAGAIAGGIGEGAVTAGQQMSQTDYNVDPLRAAGAATAAGIGTGIIGGISGRVANKLGLADIEGSIAAGTLGAGKKAGAGAYAGRIAGGAVQEGALEEMPQSAQEQVWQNVANSKPWDEGVGKASAQGLVAGMAMGAGVNALPGSKYAESKRQPVAEPPAADQPEIAGLLPAPNYTGTPSDQLLQAEAERQNSVDAAQKNADQLYAERAAYEEAMKALYPSGLPTLTTDPEPLQQRIDAMLGIDQNGLKGLRKVQYQKQLEAAFSEVVGVTHDADGREIPLTMGALLDSQAMAEEAAMRRVATENANLRAQDLADQESRQQQDIAPGYVAPEIPVVGPLSAIANLAVQSGAHAQTQMQAAMQEAVAKQKNSKGGAAGTPAGAQKVATAPAQGPLAEVASAAAPSVAPAAPSIPAQAPNTGAENSDSITEHARAWDRANRNSRSDEWFAGYAESNPAFNAVGEAGDRIPAHGMAKVATLGEGVKNLISLLTGGIDPNRTFYYDSLTANTGNRGSGTGTAGGHAYRNGPFIITFREGLQGQPTAADITGVLVNPAHSELVAPLQQMFPNLAIRDYNGVSDVVAASRSQRQANAPQAGAQPVAAPAASQSPAIDLSQRTDGQLAYLSQHGKNGRQEAAIAEIQRRGVQVSAAQQSKTDAIALSGNVNSDKPATNSSHVPALNSANSANGQQEEAGIPASTAGGSRSAPAASAKTEDSIGWTRMTTVQREALVAKAGWTGKIRGMNLGGVRIARQAWGDMTEANRAKLIAASQNPIKNEAPSAATVPAESVAPKQAPIKKDEQPKNASDRLRSGEINVEQFMEATGLTDDDVGTFSSNGARNKADAQAKKESRYHAGIEKISAAIFEAERGLTQGSTAQSRRAYQANVAKYRQAQETLGVIAKRYEHPFKNTLLSKLPPFLESRFGKQWDGIEHGDSAKRAFHGDSYRKWVDLLIGAADNKNGTPISPAVSQPKADTAPEAKQDKAPVSTEQSSAVANAQATTPSIQRLQDQLDKTDPFSEESQSLTHALQSAVTDDARSAIDAGEMPVYKVTDHVSVAIHPSAQNPGMVQVTRYTKDGVIGDSQYNNIDEAVRYEGLTHKPRIAPDEAVAAIEKSIQAEAEYQARKAAPANQVPVKNEAPAAATVPAETVAPKQEPIKNEDDWLGALFGAAPTAAESASKEVQTNRQAQDKADRVDSAIAMLTGEIEASNAAAAEVAARNYKSNRKQIELKGDGPGKNGSLSISAINESRKRRTVEALQNASSSIKQAIEFIAENPDAAFKQVADMEAAVTKQFNEGFFGPSAKLDGQLDMAVGSLIGSGSYSGEGSAGRKLRMAAHAYASVDAVSQPKTDAAPEAKQGKAPAPKPKPARNNIDAENDSLFVAIAKAGGMDTDELLSNGIDSNDITYETSAKVKKDGQLGKKRRMPISFGFALPLHKKGGMSFDGMREAMQQYGYLPQDATKNDAIDLFKQELAGDPVYTAQAIEFRRDQDQEEFDKQMAKEQDRIDAELAAQEIAEDDAGFNELSLDEQSLASDFAEFAFGENGKQDDNATRAGMRALGFTEEEINDELAKNSRAQRESEEIAAGSGQEGGAGRDGNRAEDAQVRELGGQEGFDLAGQTNSQAAEEFAQQQTGENGAPTKAQADKERDAVPFSLGMQSQPKPQGVQTGLFTADGRVSVEAKPADTADAKIDKSDDWLAELFGDPQSAEDKAINESQLAQQAQDKADRVDAAIAMLTGEIEANNAAAAELSARKYNANKKQIELAGDGPGNNGSMSISAINESRKRRAIEASLNASSSIKQAIEFIAENPDGAFKQVADMESAVTKQFNEGFFGPSANLDRQLDMAVGSLIGSGSYSGEGSAGRKLRMAASAYATVDAKKEAESKPVAENSAEKNSADSKATADAGEELTYNKRNRRTGGLKWDDVKDKNAALRVKEVVKAKVYPKPDYQALVDGGMRDVVAHIVKQAYDGIAPAPKIKRGAEVSDAALQSYIAGVNRIMDGVMKWANDGTAVAKWAKAQSKLSGGSFSISELETAETLLDTVYPGGWKTYREEIIMLGGNKILGALQPGHDEVGRALKDIKLGWPAKSEAWQKQGYKVVNAETIDVELYAKPERGDSAAYVSAMVTANNQRIDSFVVRGTADKESQEVQDAIAEKRKQLEGNYVLIDKSGRVEGIYPAEVAAIEAAREKVKRESGEKIGEKGVSVAMAERLGVEHRLPGDDVSSERLKETFGFRGVNFGNWMQGETKAKTAERQLHLNHLFDAFMDLAQLLNVPPKAMSLNGMLGIAVGAQGSGKAWAHFVPGVNEINVTRTNGAGALAHEWGHALDHYFATMGGMDRNKEPYLSAHVGTLTNRVENGRYVRTPVELANVRPEVAAQFQSIVEAMTKRKETDAEYADRIRRDKDIAGQMVADEIKKITEDIGQAKGGWGTPSFIAEIRGLAERIAALDYGDGRVSIGSSEVPAVVAEIAEAYKAASGVPLKNAETLGYYADHYRVMSAILESEEGRTPREVNTDYKKASDAADSKKKPYWSTKLEMFARAFDAYVVDSLAEKAASNTYLAGIEAVAPQGDERKTIGKAFDFLFAELKTKETEQGVMLYNQASAGKISPADKAIYGMAAEGKSAAEILKFIALTSRSPLNRQLAKLLQKTGITPSVKVDSSAGWKMNAGNDKKYAAAYNPKTDTVALFRPASAERHVLHELMHAATLKALSKKGMAAGQMKALFAHVKKSGELNGMYGMSDVDEFIAEAFSNPKFQSMLKQVSAMPVGGKPSSAWDWFVRVVRGILGLKRGQDNALSQALDIGIGVMRENMRAATPNTQTGYAGARGSEMRERPSVRAVTGPMAEPAQSKVGAGGKTDAIDISDSVQASAIKAAQKVQDESNAFDLEAEIKSVSENGEADLSSLIANPKYWDAENEEFTDEGYRQVDLLNEQKARDNLRLLSITELSDLDSAYHKAQYAAMVSIFDGMGIPYKDTSSNSSKYLEVGRLKLRFANHANTTRSVMAQVSNMDEVTSLINVAPGEYRFAEALDAVMREMLSAGSDAAPGKINQTDTEAFKRWFGDSKVVDANGEPLVGRELAVAMYDRGASSATVAKALGDVSVATVKRWVSSAGAQRNASEARGGTKENRSEAVRLYREGLGAFEIAKRLGVSNRGVYNWLRDAGVEIRSMSEAQSLRAAQGRQPIRGVRSIVSTKWGDVRADSVYEAARLRQLESDQEVENVGRATESIKWGENQRYTPDFMVKMKDGRVRVEEVKPTFQQDRDDVVAKAEAAREALGDDVDYRMVVTEDLASGFIALRNMQGLSFASDTDRGRFKRALATAKSATSNNGSFDGSNPDIRYNVADEGWSVSEQAKEVVMRLAGRPMLDPADPFAAENARLREQDKSLWSKAKKQMRRYLAPGGLLPQSVFAEKIKRDSEFQAVEFDVRHLIGGLEQAVKADFGIAFDKLSKEQMRPITEALAGNVPASLPEATKTAAVAMRQYIDGMSTEYLKIIQQKIDAKMLKAMESGKESDKAQAINEIELFEKIKGNIGRYVHRSYQAFDDPKWFEKVPAPVLNASRLYLKQGYMEAGETDAKAAQLAEVTLHEILKNGTAYDSMESFIAESKLGAKDLSVLMRRKEVPAQIRALLGEYPDARLNFTKSATKMGRLIWNTRFLDRVRDIGMGSFFFEGKDRPANATTQIAAGGSEAYAPLNGLWTFPEIAQSFKDALGKEQMSDLYRAIVRANGLVKYGKTVLAPTTAMRNWQSAMFFSLANGHFDLTQMKKSISAFREQVSQKATGQDLKYLRHLKQLGVVYDTPYAGEMARLMEDARMDELLSSDKGDAVRWFRKANQLAQGFYTFGDDFWKIIGFENEKSGLMKAGLSLQESEIEAAKRIRDTYPTYSMVGRGVQWLSRFPLAGTFVSFPAEIIRTSSNMLRTVANDLKSDNPKLRELGMKRAAGMAFVSAAFYGLAALSMAMAGVGDDEDEAIRDLAPEWQKNSTFLYLGRDEKGSLRYFDMSFLDPYGYWKRPITAMLRNQPWEDSLASGLRGMLEPFLGADISAAAIFEAVSNQKESGGKVYKEKDGAIDQAVDIADHLRKALQPGVVGNVERLVKAAGDVRKSSGQPYSMEDELVALAGWRATTIEPKTALYYRSFEFTDSIAEARKTLTDTLRDANDVSPEDIKDARERAKSKQEQAFKEMSRLVGAAEAAGMSKMQIVQTLRLSNISQANIASLMRGATPDVSITPQLAARAVRQASQMRGPEFAADVFDRYRQAMAK